MTLPPDPAARTPQERTEPEEAIRFAVLSDTHLSPEGTPDGIWNNTTRRSASAALLQAALAEITESGHEQVLVLGDISDDGTVAMIRAALGAIAAAGIRAWIVPGNHDVALSPEALDAAAIGLTATCALARKGPQRLAGSVAAVGIGLHSDSGGQTCQATSLPDVAALAGRLLLCVGHYPILTQQARLRVAGLRYPGDLVNLDHARAAVERFDGPIVALHGHLHTAVTRRVGRILQIGLPAVVEWPHAWTDFTLDMASDNPTVHVEIRPIAGEWSRCERDTVLSGMAQTWVFDAGRWRAQAFGAKDHASLS